MGLFDKKYCDICGEKIGLLGNRKLENVLTQIEVDYLGNDDYEYELTINYRDGEFVAEKPEKGSAVYDSYKYSTAIDIDGLKAEDIRGNVETVSYTHLTLPTKLEV